MKPRRSWEIPVEPDFANAKSQIHLSGTLLGRLSMWGQVIAIPLLAGLLFFSR